jgi:ERCC4-type nuclease
MKLIIYIREKSLYDSCQKFKNIDDTFKDLNIESKTLEIGDIIIQNDDNTDIIIFERKTIDDLVSSIKDGRYSEQSFRLNGSAHHNHNIAYLIEGSPMKYTKNKQMIYSSMFSICFYKGFSLIKSSNVEETAYILCNAVLKLIKEKSKPFYYANSELAESGIVENKEEKSYSTVVCKSKKNANITPENFGEILLMQIPSVNSVTAIAIMDIYKTINNLIDALKENSDCLNDIKYKTSSGQMRKISKTCIENINKFLIQ